ncbi:MAG: hypothetical protein GY851_21010, partial [bacterium]|nr:hypothetical protein [bacterium]
LTHLATNGAGVIHDWEFAYQGHSSEDVRTNVAAGTFGIWEETGFYINLAVRVGAYRGLGYGASVAELIHREGLDIPSREQLAEDIAQAGDDLSKAAAAADLLRGIDEAKLETGWLDVPHPFKDHSLLGLAGAHGLPLTVHPMIGHDIIYTHPFNDCAAIGRAAERDFLHYAGAVENLEGGVYLSVGSAIMSPMVFEKSLSMARNLVLQRGGTLDDFLIVVVDIVPSQWDWSKGEPGWDTPEFYVRFNKTFSRMGGQFRYICADNRDFILALAKRLD